eukprot:8753536-Prorocentrum_lima.AAC.1
MRLSRQKSLQAGQARCIAFPLAAAQCLGAANSCQVGARSAVSGSSRQKSFQVGQAECIASQLVHAAAGG